MIAERIALTALLLLAGRWLWVSDVMPPWRLLVIPGDVYGTTVLLGLFGFYGNLGLIALVVFLLWLIWLGDRK